MTKLGHLHNLLEGLHEITLSKAYREQQLSRVIGWWLLLENSLVPQSWNSWYNALGCSHTHKDAISKQRVGERETWGSLLKYVKETFKMGQQTSPTTGHQVYIATPRNLIVTLKSRENKAFMDCPPHRNRTSRHSKPTAMVAINVC